MSESSQGGWQPGDEANGYRWNGTTWERIWRAGDKANGYVFDGQSWGRIPPPPWWRTTPAIVAACVVVLLSFLGLVFILGGSRQQPKVAPADSSGQDLLWIPRGFQYYTPDRSLAYSFTAPEGDAAKCGYGDQCAKFAVASQNSCPGGIYVAISVLDEEGIVVDSSNEITGGVGAGDIAAVAIPLFDSAGTQYRVSEMSCLD